MEDILLFVAVVFGLLSLILFFKIWAMAGKVAAIEKMMADRFRLEQGFNQKLYTVKLNGEVKEGVAMLNESYLRELGRKVQAGRLGSYSEEDFKKDRDALVARYRPFYQFLDTEIPAEFFLMEYKTTGWIWPA